MISEECKNKFENLGEGPRELIIQSAYQEELIWINVAKSYGFEDGDGRELRDYIRNHYHADGKRMQP